MADEVDEFHVMKSNSTSSLTKDCHCFIIGDVSVGKASLLHQYFRKSLPERKITAEYNPISIPQSKQWEPFRLHLQTNVGSILSKGHIRTSEIILLCFSIEKKKTLSRIESFWLPEINKSLEKRDCLFLLVGSHADKRDRPEGEEEHHSFSFSKQEELVSLEEAQEVASRIGCKYVEVSALTGRGIKTLFEEEIPSIVATARTENLVQLMSEDLPVSDEKKVKVKRSVLITNYATPEVTIKTYNQHDHIRLIPYDKKILQYSDKVEVSAKGVEAIFVKVKDKHSKQEFIELVRDGSYTLKRVEESEGGGLRFVKNS
mmetsp:Transcript_5881/g.7716  ORF Transcript_5881/g.7716 Transcript_5881/m.7716 type:complete len:316 (+) Transcript_5881:29-976(+)